MSDSPAVRSTRTTVAQAETPKPAGKAEETKATVVAQRAPAGSSDGFLKGASAGETKKAASPVAAAAQEPVRIYQKDYRPPAYDIPKIDLRFDIHEKDVEVTAVSQMQRHPGQKGPVVLNGRDSELVAVKINGRALSQTEYKRDGEKLIIDNAPERFELTVVTRLTPETNTTAEGLYSAGGQLLTQCEPDGFRHITFAPDRPDVMSVYTTTVTADKERFPRLLSNGNETAKGELPDGRHYVSFLDPFPKPSYLFALVAGLFDELNDKLVTKSGRNVSLEIYSDPGDREKTRWAMECIKAAMNWDEEANGFDCDLDRFAIVVTSVFNFGAMENKGLNIFNASAALADPRTATDADFAKIDRIIGHEYFHNRTGNRITLRDPLQLTLKEGLTVFRDQEYSSTRRDRADVRFESVRTVITGQFAEDAGPQAHAIRPESYIAPQNLYTDTVYRKGAEVIRMLQTLVGKEGFRKGMDEYFRRHDGQAVTTDDFLAAIAEPNGFDSSVFARWYSQIGTPTVKADGVYDPVAKTYTLTLEQKPGRPGYPPLHIPVRFGLVGAKGDLPLHLRGSKDAGTEAVLELKEEKHTFVFENVDEPPVPSILRDFSAPVKVEMERPTADLETLLARDSDPYNRFDASQRLATAILRDMVEDVQKGGDAAKAASDKVDRYIESLRAVLQDKTISGTFKARLLGLPAATTLAQDMPVWDFDAIETARTTLRAAVGKALEPELAAIYSDAVKNAKPYAYNQEQVGARALKNTALWLRVAADAPSAFADASAQFKNADNMTDRLDALTAMVAFQGDRRETKRALTAFYAEFADEPLVLDKWFALQAGYSQTRVLEKIRALMQHEKYDTKVPNRVRSVIGSFIGNVESFHAKDGSGYAFVADQVIAMSKVNAHVAASFARALGNWRRVDEGRSAQMRAELSRILAEPKLSHEVHEVVANALKS